MASVGRWASWGVHGQIRFQHLHVGPTTTSATWIRALFHLLPFTCGALSGSGMPEVGK